MQGGKYEGRNLSGAVVESYDWIPFRNATGVPALNGLLKLMSQTDNLFQDP